MCQYCASPNKDLHMDMLVENNGTNYKDIRWTIKEKFLCQNNKREQHEAPYIYNANLYCNFSGEWIRYRTSKSKSETSES